MNRKREPRGRVNRLPGITSASLTGRRRLLGSDTRAFSPGFNMTGLRPWQTGVDASVAEAIRAEQRWVARRVKPRKDGQMVGYFRMGSMEKRVEVGKGGWAVGKRGGFAYMAPTSTRLEPVLNFL